MHTYDVDRCVECGRCLYECPYNDLTLAQAIDTIKKMRLGDVRACEFILDHCVFCYNCDYSCPVNAHPAALMLERHEERRRGEKATPSSLRYLVNGIESHGWGHNLFRDLYSAHDDTENAVISEWSRPKDCGDGDLLWCSCATRIFPYDIANSTVLSGLEKFGGVSDCCGLPAMRSGLVDAGRRVSDDLVDRLSQCRFNRLVVMCGSCQDMFCNFMPGHLDQKFPFPVISIYEYLDEQIQNGRLTIQRQIEPQKKEEKECVSIFHSCYGHTFGDAYLSAIDRLAKAVGYDCEELAHTGEKNLCCGMGGIYRKGSLRDILKVRGLKRKDLKQSHARKILAYCYGCFFMSHLLQSGTTHFLLEKLLWALGDDIRYPMNKIFGRALNLRTVKHMIGIAPSALR